MRTNYKRKDGGCLSPPPGISGKIPFTKGQAATINVKATMGASGSSIKASKTQFVSTPLQETADTCKNTDQDRLCEERDQVSMRDFQSEALTSSIDAFHLSGNPQKIAANQTQNQSISSNGYSTSFKAGNIKTSKVLVKDEKRNRVQESKRIMPQNPFGYKFAGLSTTKDTNFQTLYRSQEWSKVLVNIREMERQPKQHAQRKSEVTNQAFKEPEDVMVPNSGFRDNPRERSYQRRNESSINQLRSIRSLDYEGKDQEYKLLGISRGSISLVQAINRDSSLDSHKYGSGELPPEFVCHRKRPSIIHNMANPVVQAARIKNFRSVSLA